MIDLPLYSSGDSLRLNILPPSVFIRIAATKNTIPINVIPVRTSPKNNIPNIVANIDSVGNTTETVVELTKL